MNSLTHYPRPASVTPLFPDPTGGMPSDCEPDPMAGDFDAAQFDHLAPDDPQIGPIWRQQGRERAYEIARATVLIAAIGGVVLLMWAALQMFGGE